jgi:hypothetical protein
MMEPYILIMLLYMGAAPAARFDDKQACIDAGILIMNDLKEVSDEKVRAIEEQDEEMKKNMKNAGPPAPGDEIARNAELVRAWVNSNKGQSDARKLSEGQFWCVPAKS